MSRIYVRTKPGRVARESRLGNLIPHDTFVAVRPTAYIDRLINVHQDIEVRQEQPIVPKTEEPPKKANK